MLMRLSLESTASTDSFTMPSVTMRMAGHKACCLYFLSDDPKVTLISRFVYK